MNQKNLNSSYIDVYEVLDEILGEKLGIRLVEPVTNKGEKFVAKPILFQKLNEKMKDYKQGYMAPKRIMTTNDVKKQTVPVIAKNEYHHFTNFSLGIKLGMAEVSQNNKFIAEEVAYWMDDMLDAVENGNLKVENKAKKKIQNDVMRRKVYSINRLKVAKK